MDHCSDVKHKIYSKNNVGEPTKVCLREFCVDGLGQVLFVSFPVSFVDRPTFGNV